MTFEKGLVVTGGLLGGAVIGHGAMGHVLASRRGERVDHTPHIEKSFLGWAALTTGLALTLFELPKLWASVKSMVE